MGLVQPSLDNPTTRSAARPRGLPIFAAAWLLSAAICLRLITVPGYPGDTDHYKYWTRLVTTEGIQAAYSGTYPETYAIYPPVTLYAYGLLGHVYRRLYDPAFDVERMLASRELTVGIKAVAVSFHLALGAALFALLARWYSGRAAAFAAAAYLLNPSVIFDVAYWGQPDAAHSLLAVLAFGLPRAGRWAGGWVAAALAALTKPQAWAVLPLFAFGQLRRGGPLRVLIGALIGGLTVVVVLLPFILTRRLHEFLTLPREMADTMPVASAYAHNLWWLVTGGAQPLIFDKELLAGPLSYRDASLALMAAFSLLVFRLAWRGSAERLTLLAAYQAFGWFVLTTRAHENHAFFVLPLLALALPVARWPRLIFAGISATLLLNMVLHDPLLAPGLETLISPDAQWRLQMADAAANLLLLLGWSLALLRPRPAASEPA